MTYKEAIESGYKELDQTYQRGYVSRKESWENRPVMDAGGSRKGQYYITVPCYISSRYCVRQYLLAPETRSLQEAGE